MVNFRPFINFLLCTAWPDTVGHGTTRHGTRFNVSQSSVIYHCVASSSELIDAIEKTWHVLSWDSQIRQAAWGGARGGARGWVHETFVIEVAWGGS